MSTLRRVQKAALELEKQASTISDIRELWQRKIDLGKIFGANNQVGLGQVPESQPNNSVSSPYSPSKNLRGGASLLADQETLKNQRIEISKNLNNFLRLVIEQGKKYETRLLPHSNFYRRYLMVQQFF